MLLGRIWKPGIQDKTENKEGILLDNPSWFPGFQIDSCFFFIRWPVLANDAEDIVLAHDQVGLAVHLDLGAAVFGDQHFVALLHRELDLLTVFVHFAGAESDDLPFLRLFLGGIGDDDAALFGFFLFDRLHKHAISEGSYINCHVLVTPSSVCFGWLMPKAASLTNGFRQIVKVIFSCL